MLKRKIVVTAIALCSPLSSQPLQAIPLELDLRVRARS